MATTRPRADQIGSGNVSNTEFEFVDSMDQHVATDSDVDFASLAINADKADKDSVICGVTDDYLLYTDASTGRIGVGKNNPAEKFDVNGDIKLLNNLYGTVSQPLTISIPGQSSPIQPITILGADHLTESGPFGSVIIKGGTISLQAWGTSGYGESVVINDDGLSFDTRIEGDTDEYLVNVDASTDRVGFGVAVPGAKVDIYHATTADGVLVYDTATQSTTNTNSINAGTANNYGLTAQAYGGSDGAGSSTINIGGNFNAFGAAGTNSGVVSNRAIQCWAANGDTNHAIYITAGDVYSDTGDITLADGDISISGTVDATTAIATPQINGTGGSGLGSLKINVGHIPDMTWVYSDVTNHDDELLWTRRTWKGNVILPSGAESDSYFAQYKENGTVFIGYYPYFNDSGWYGGAYDGAYLVVPNIANGMYITNEAQTTLYGEIDGTTGNWLLDTEDTFALRARYKLDVNGIIRIQGTNVLGFGGDTTTDYVASISHDGTDLNISTTGEINVTTDKLDVTGPISATGEVRGDQPYGEMYIYEASTLTPIYTTSIYHALRFLSTGLVNNFTYTAGKTGPISSVSDYSGTVTGAILITDEAHGLDTDDIITVNGTTSYNQTFKITVVDLDSFYVIDTYVADETGYWQRGDRLRCGSAGVYKLSWNISGDASNNGDVFKIEANKGTTALDNIVGERTFSNGTDYTPLSASGLVSLAAGDDVWLSMKNKSGTGDFTTKHANVNIVLVK